MAQSWHYEIISSIKSAVGVGIEVIKSLVIRSMDIGF